jgi:RHS repeat-associated protein
MACAGSAGKAAQSSWIPATFPIDLKDEAKHEWSDSMNSSRKNWIALCWALLLVVSAPTFAATPTESCSQYWGDAPCIAPTYSPSTSWVYDAKSIFEAPSGPEALQKYLAAIPLYPDDCYGEAGPMTCTFASEPSSWDNGYGRTIGYMSHCIAMVTIYRHSSQWSDSEHRQIPVCAPLPQDKFISTGWSVAVLGCPSGYEKTTGTEYPFLCAPVHDDGDPDKSAGNPEDSDGGSPPPPAPPQSPQPPSPGDADAGSGGHSSCANSPVAGEPINSANGNKFEAAVDYVPSGPSPLRFVRYYDSAMPTDGSMGSNWRHFYDRHIESVSTTEVKARRPDGKAFDFKQVNSEWRAAPDVIVRLQPYIDAGGQTQGWKLTTSQDAVETYDNTGRLLQITERNGTSQTLLYGSDGRLATVSDSFGHTLAFRYDPQGRVNTVIDPAGNAYGYSYDENGNLATFTPPDNRIITYLYENSGLPHALTGIMDGNNIRIDTTQYDESGRATYNEQGTGTSPVTLAYAEDGSATITDGYGTSRAFTFELLQGVMKATGLSRTCPDCGASTRQFTHDANGNVTSRTDFNGIRTIYGYDLSRNLETSRTEAAGTAQERTISIEWHAYFRLPTRITEPGRVTDMSYDDNGNMTLLAITDTTMGEQRQWTYTYGLYGLLASVTQPGGDSTSYLYDGSGNLTSATTLSGLTTQYSNYDADGRVGRVVYPGGQTIDFTYDTTGHLLTRTETVQAPSPQGSPLDALRLLLDLLRQLLGMGGDSGSTIHPATGQAAYRYTYDPAGLLTDITTADNGIWHFDYDTAYRLVQRKDPLGHITQILRDPEGNITETDIYDGSTLLEKHSYRYDSLGRLAQISGNSGQLTTLAYDDEDELLSATDVLGHQTAWSHDPLYRTSSTTDATHAVTKLEHNALDQTTSITDARGNVTAYTPDAFDEVIREESPDRGTMQRAYLQGRLQTETDARDISHAFTYDADGRPTNVTATHSQVQYHYDEGDYGGGRLTSFSDNSGKTEYSYNSQGLVSEKVSTITNGAILKVDYSYTLGGQPREISTPGHHLITYSHDDNGRISAVSVDGKLFLSQIQFGANDIVGWTWANGAIRDERRDLDGRITGITSGNALLRQYGYDAADRLTSLTDTRAGINYSYGYDDSGRLVLQQGNGISTTYTYDANGNRQQQTSTTGGNTQTTTYQTDSGSNRLQSETSRDGTRRYDYLASGQTASDGRLAYTYDDEGRLAEAHLISPSSPTADDDDVGPSVEHNDYNALGQRVLKRGHGILVYAYDEAGHLLGEYLPGGFPVREYVWLGNRLVGMISVQQPGVVLQVHTDHLGTPRAVSKGNTVLWRWEGDAFGNSKPNETVAGMLHPLAMPLRFPGQYHDDETGLNYNYFRDYNPTIGRYIENDPIGLGGGMNTYAYVGGSVTIWIDPLGLAWCTLHFWEGQGRLICEAESESNENINIPVASGNNGDGENCKNNPECDTKTGRGPIPTGSWMWTNDQTSKPNGRTLLPVGEFDGKGRTLIRSHSCKNAFGPSKAPPFCSAGCVTGTPSDIKKLNRLLDAEPNSTLTVQNDNMY